MRIIAIALCLIATPSILANQTTIEEAIHFAFQKASTLKMMESRTKYTLPIRGVEQTGYKERFLRERKGKEISDSGFSSGCGDFTAVFVHELEKLGISSLVVDGPEISVRSLQFRFSGHSVVAVPVGTEEEPRFWLVDPSSRRILDKDWKLDSNTFEAFATTFWIGYVGTIDKYPARGSSELKEFYDRTLKSIPSDVLEKKLLERLQNRLNRSVLTTPEAAPPAS